MAKTNPDSSAGLLNRLLSHGCTFDFFQAVWLLERYLGGRVAVGERGPVAQESFRFRPDVSMAFPGTDVHSIRRCTDPSGETAFHLIEVTFLGLYGVATPLPLHYATGILRSVERDVATDDQDGAQTSGGLAPGRVPGSSPVRDFLDIFHHRLISLFYRSWLKYRYDRTFGQPGRDKITDYLLWLIGYSPGHDKATLGVEPIRLLRYAGAFTQRPRSATMLEGLLRDYWMNHSIEVKQCDGRWVPIPRSDQNRIGAVNSSLGKDLTIGDEVYDLGGAFTVALGPIDWETYLTFLPDGARFAQTRSLVRQFCIDPLSFTFELCLGAGEVPEARLSSDAGAPRLGLTSWVRTDPMPQTSVRFAASLAVSSVAEPSKPEVETGAQAA